MAEPGDRRVAGGSGMSASFDVLVRSVDALNATLRSMSQDMQRMASAQQTFTPGGTQHPGPQGQPTPPPGQPRPVNPQAGQTTQGTMGQGRYSIGRAASRFAAAFAAGQTQNPQQTQQQGQPQQPGQSQPMQPVPPPAFPFQPGGPQGPMGPYGPGGGPPGGPGGPGGPAGPQQPGGQGPQWWGQGPGYYFGHQSGSGGWTNMLLGGARRLPYVGTAIAGVTAVQNLYLSEREKNRTYQGMEGGSNFAGFGERLHEEAYRWSMPGMSGDMARRSFKGVTALGYTGKSQTTQGRQEALDFVYHNYNARGMDPEESLGMLQTASHDATVNFQELSSALKEVSDTAGKAGVNAKFMRQSFQGMLAATINQGGGPGSADVAGALTSAQASYGREFQGMDFRGQVSRQYQYMLGAQYGVSAGQLQGIMRNQPGEYTRMVAGSQREWINTVFSPQQIADLQGLIKKYGTSQAAIGQIEQEFLNNHPEIDLNVIADTLSGDLTGVQLDNSNVMDWVIQQLAGNTAAAHGTQSQANKPVNKNNTAGARTGKTGLVERTGGRGLRDQIEGLNVEGGFKANIPGAKWMGIETENKAAQAYLKSNFDKGKRDPVLEALLQNIKDPNSTKVKVSTASGDRIVSFEEAMRLFPNELAAGKVQVVTGDQAGKTTSELSGGNVDPSRDIRGELTNKSSQKAGQSLEDYEKKHGKIKGTENAAAGKVTVDLTEEAKRLLQLLPSTNNQANATGYPPFNPNPQQGSRP